MKGLIGCFGGRAGEGWEMGENTKISWAHHTWNAWMGCQKVSPACENCYAEGWAKRSGLVQWGPKADRRRTSESKWREPDKWNQRAKANGVREQVFVNSLSDWAEAREDLNAWRSLMFAKIKQWDALDFLLLTKRADNILNCLPPDWGSGYPNVWLGVTAENQEWAERRIPHLMQVPAKIRFISAEPLLGEIDLTRLCVRACADDAPIKPIGYTVEEYNALSGEIIRGRLGYFAGRIHQVIVGGESGPKHRPLNLDYARKLRRQCEHYGTSYFFKQVGGLHPDSGGHLLDGVVIQQMPEVGK